MSPSRPDVDRDIDVHLDRREHQRPTSNNPTSNAQQLGGDEAGSKPRASDLARPQGWTVYVGV